MNNIYDRVKQCIKSYELTNREKPKIIEMGIKDYYDLCEFILENNMDKHLMTKIDGCLIKLTADDGYMTCKGYITCGANNIEKETTYKQVDGLIDKLMDVECEELTQSKSDKIDEDLDYMVKELEFQRWLEKNNRL